jgi:hypothetical protein
MSDVVSSKEPTTRKAGNLAFTIIVQCEQCGKTGDDRDIPTLQFPDGNFKTLCEECFKKASK